MSEATRYEIKQPQSSLMKTCHLFNLILRQTNFLCFVFFSRQRLSNGSMESAHEASQVVELQDLLEKQNYELAQMKERMSSLSSRVSEVEQELETARKDLIKSEEMNNKYQRDIKEVGLTRTRRNTSTLANC